MAHEFLDHWLLATDMTPPELKLVLLSEKDDGRAVCLDRLRACLARHFVVPEDLERLSFAKAAAVVRASLPIAKRIRSGDLAEVLATEYVPWRTPFVVPVRRLQYKDDRNLSMRGDDVIGLWLDGATPRVLKSESKSRASISPSVIAEACSSLAKNDHRPNPATLAFLERRLRRDGLDTQADIVHDLQRTPAVHGQVTHLIFAMSGNNPEASLRSAPAPWPVARLMVGLRISDHQAFISLVFDDTDA